MSPASPLRFEQRHNFRDLGGVETGQGQRLRSGVFFRCSELQRCTARDLAQLEALGIKLICDLRSPRESARKQPRQLWAPAPRLVNVPLHDPRLHDGQRWRISSFLWGKDGVERFRAYCRLYYQHVVFDRGALIGEAITVLANRGNQPALIHCTAGKDRTGLVAALIQLLLGVPFATVLAEYLRTNEATEPRLERLLGSLCLPVFAPAFSERMRVIVATHPEYLLEVHARIISDHGSIERYLSTVCGVQSETVERLRHLLLE